MNPVVPTEITNFTADALALVTAISVLAAVAFIIRGGFLYITSSGKPEALFEAKKTLRNAILGLVLVLFASSFISLLSGALVGSTGLNEVSNIPVVQIESVKPRDGLAQVLTDTINGMLQNLVESSTKPIVDGILTFLTSTPTLLNNTPIVKFWIMMVGIVDVLFVLVLALLGLQLMSASTFGFEELEFKQILPRVGLAFLGANISLFLADYLIQASNALVAGVISATGGINHAWVLNAVNIERTASPETPIITLVFLLIFLVVAIVLLVMYISRLIVISLSAVLSPFIFLLWAIPKTSDFAEISIKGYIVSVFTIFVHVVAIQLAGSFLALPEQTNNSLISIAVAIGLLLTLLKMPSTLMQLVLFSSRMGSAKQIGGQLVNVISAGSNYRNMRRVDGPVIKSRRVANI